VVKLLYFFDLFFWYLQKLALLIILIWLGHSWWEKTQAAKEEHPPN
jgi:uncharacterized membrane protein YkgB